MTYDEIITELRALKCGDTAAGLEAAVEVEAIALIENTTNNGKLVHKCGRRYPNEGAREAAKKFYAEDITMQLAKPASVTPNAMLNLRRFPVVWAVAEVLRTNRK